MQLRLPIRWTRLTLVAALAGNGCLPLRTGPLADTDAIVADVPEDRAPDRTLDDAAIDAPTDLDVPMDAQDAQDARTIDAGIDVRADVLPDVRMDVPSDRPVPTDVPPADVMIPACSLPLQPAITSSSAVVMSTLSGASNVPFARCDIELDGPEHIYPFTLSHRSSVDVRITNPGAGLDPTLYIRRQCADDRTEVACVRASSLRTTLDPGAYFLFVDQHSATATTIGGDYTLSFDSSPLAPNASCAAAVPLAPDVTVTGSTRMAERGMLCVFSDEYPLHWRATIPAGQRLRAIVQPAMGERGTVGVGDSCTMFLCEGFPQQSPMPGAPTFTTIDTLPGGGARDVLLFAGSDGPGTYSLRYTLETPEPGTSWLTAYPLVVNGPTQSFRAMPGSRPMSCMSWLDTYVLYTIEVPARTSVRLFASYSGLWRVAVQADPQSGGCIADSDLQTGGATTIGPFENTDSVPRTFYIAVGGDGLMIRAVGTPL